MNEPIRDAFASIPLEFEQVVERTLERIAQQEAASFHPAKRKIRLGLIAAVATLLVSVVAIAAVLSGKVFTFQQDYMMPEYLVVQESAYSLLRTDLAKRSFAHTDVAVREAIFDGQEIRVAISFIDRSIKDVMTGDPYDNWSNMQALQADGITYCDGLVIDGQQVQLRISDIQNGEEPGELLYYLQANLPENGVHPQGKFTVTLPIPFNVPEQMNFVMDETPTRELVKSTSGQIVDGSGLRVEVMDATFSPMVGMLNLQITAQDATTAEQTERLASPWLNATLAAFLPDGTRLLGGMNGYSPSAADTAPGSVDAQYIFVPPAQWPNKVIFMPLGEDDKPMTEWALEVEVQ